jgi:hypothetical protein
MGADGLDRSDPIRSDPIDHDDITPDSDFDLRNFADRAHSPLS